MHSLLHLGTCLGTSGVLTKGNELSGRGAHFKPAATMQVSPPASASAVKVMGEAAAGLTVPP